MLELVFAILFQETHGLRIRGLGIRVIVEAGHVVPEGLEIVKLLVGVQDPLFEH